MRISSGAWNSIVNSLTVKKSANLYLTEVFRWNLSKCKKYLGIHLVYVKKVDLFKLNLPLTYERGNDN